MDHTVNASFKSISINSSSIMTLSSSTLQRHQLVILERKNDMKLSTNEQQSRGTKHKKEECIRDIIITQFRRIFSFLDKKISPLIDNKESKLGTCIWSLFIVPIASSWKFCSTSLGSSTINGFSTTDSETAAYE